MNKNLQFQRKLLRAALQNRSLPEKVRSRLPELEGIFANIRPPKNEKTQKRVVGGVEAISSRLRMIYQLDMLHDRCDDESLDAVIDERMDLIKMKIGLIANLAKASIGSRKAKQFFRLISGKDCNIEGFIYRVKAFSGEREVEFEEVPESVQLVANMICAGAESDEELKNLAIMVMAELMVQEPPDEYEECGEYYDGNIEEVYHILVDAVRDKERVIAILNQLYPEFCKKYEENLEDFGADRDPWEYMESAFEVVLERLGVYKLSEDDDYSLLPFDRTFNLGNVTGYMIANGGLAKIGYAGVAFGTDMLFDSGDGAVVHHELQHVFDNSLGIRDTFVGGEYRAYLAELVFTKDLLPLYSRRYKRLMSHSIVPTMRVNFDLVWGHEMNVPQGFRHDYAKCKVFRKLRKLFRSKADPFKAAETPDFGAIRAEARKLLNQEYKDLVGLTYDEMIRIFEPLGR